MNAPSVDYLQLDNPKILHNDNRKNHSYYRVQHCHLPPLLLIRYWIYIASSRKNTGWRKFFQKRNGKALFVGIDETVIFLLCLFFGVSIFCLQQPQQFL